MGHFITPLKPNDPMIIPLSQQSAATLPPGYADAVLKMMNDAARGLRRAVNGCLINPSFMRYNPEATGDLENSAAIFPAATWLRAYFHDAGTFLKSPGKGGKVGGPNGSLGAGCPNNVCGKCQAGADGCLNPGGTDPAPFQVSCGHACVPVACVLWHACCGLRAVASDKVSVPKA
jgi:hypothetical protein